MFAVTVTVTVPPGATCAGENDRVAVGAGGAVIVTVDAPPTVAVVLSWWAMVPEKVYRPGVSPAVTV